MSLKAGPLARWTDRVQQEARDTIAWDELVHRVRSGPPRLLKALDASLNTLDVFVPDGFPAALAKTNGGTTVKGPVGEVALWVLGRRSVARVEVS